MRTTMDTQSVYRTDERPEELLRTLEQLERDLDRCVELNRPMLGGERYLTDRELSERLKISRRTLQEHRSSHEIPYYCVCGKILYRESSVFLRSATSARCGGRRGCRIGVNEPEHTWTGRGRMERSRVGGVLR